MTSTLAGGGVMQVEHLTVVRGHKTVVDDVTLEVHAGRITALLGPNGAGKSSLVLALAGVLPICRGRVLVDGRNIAGEAADVVRHVGVAAVPEGHRVLTALTVDDNLRVAGASSSARDLASALQRSYGIFPELAERRAQLAGTLSGGQQQMVALAHALMARPRFMLIDEMSLGLAPIVVQRLMGVVRGLAQEGVGILLIEQFTHLALRLADRACVMSRAGLRFSGDPKTLQTDPTALHAAYLGASA